MAPDTRPRHLTTVAKKALRGADSRTMSPMRQKGMERWAGAAGHMAKTGAGRGEKEGASAGRKAEEEGYRGERKIGKRT